VTAHNLLSTDSVYIIFFAFIFVYFLPIYFFPAHTLYGSQPAPHAFISSYAHMHPHIPCSLHVLTHLRISPYRHIRRSCRTGFFPLSTTSFMPTNQDPVLLMNVHARHALYLIMIYFPLMTFTIVTLYSVAWTMGVILYTPDSIQPLIFIQLQRPVLTAKSSGSYVTEIIRLRSAMLWASVHCSFRELYLGFSISNLAA